MSAAQPCPIQPPLQVGRDPRFAELDALIERDAQLRRWREADALTVELAQADPVRRTRKKERFIRWRERRLEYLRRKEAVRAR